VFKLKFLEFAVTLLEVGSLKVHSGLVKSLTPLLMVIENFIGAEEKKPTGQNEKEIILSFYSNSVGTFEYLQTWVLSSTSKLVEVNLLSENITEVERLVVGRAQ